jgi:hypothetical protein
MTIYLGRKKEKIMAIVTSIGRHNITDIRNQIQAALDNVGRDLGLSIKLGGIRFDEYGFRFKGESKVVGQTLGDPEAAAKLDWNHRCHFYGLTPDDYGKTVRLYNGREYQLRGFKLGRTKYPVLAIRNGRTFKLTLSWVQRALTKDIAHAALTSITTERTV